MDGSKKALSEYVCGCVCVREGVGGCEVSYYIPAETMAL